MECTRFGRTAPSEALECPQQDRPLGIARCTRACLPSNHKTFDIYACCIVGPSFCTRVYLNIACCTHACHPFLTIRHMNVVSSLWSFIGRVTFFMIGCYIRMSSLLYCWTLLWNQKPRRNSNNTTTTTTTNNNNNTNNNTNNRG